MSDQIPNPLLAKFKLPGRIFQLPSRGLLYTNGEISPSISAAEVHVQTCSALDDIYLKSPDMLFSGRAIEMVLKNCVPDILKPNDLYGKDLDAIMLFLRLVTYGPNYDITVTHTCENAKAHSYVIDLEALSQKMKYLDPTTLTEVYNITMDNGQVVQLQPVRYSHILDILKANDGKKELTADDQKKNLIMNLSNVIKSVDGIEDRKLITEWIEAIPAPFANKIAESIENTNNWGPELETELVCLDCGEMFKLEIPINPISFFS